MERLPRKQNPVYQFWKLLWSFSVSTGVLALIISFFSMNTGLTGMAPPFVYALVIFAAAVVLPIYMLPSFFAYRCRVKNARALLLWNLFFGWTVVGYFLCAFKVSRA